MRGLKVLLFVSLVWTGVCLASHHYSTTIGEDRSGPK
jgi:hypothetical protein